MIQVLVMLMMLSKHLSFLTTSLRCFYEILSGLGADELLHLSIAIINFFQEKEFHNEYCLDGSFSNNDLFTCQLWAELNVWWSTFQRFSISIYSCPLNWIALIASHFCFLIQFIRFYSLWFFNVISWILLLKNNHFVFFTVFLKSFHSSTFLNAL